MSQELEDILNHSEYSEKDKVLGYSYTNETLDAVVEGLELSGDERVLAIGPDQGFALLEHARQVVVVDVNAYSLAILKARKKLLSEGNYEGFLSFEAPNPVRTPNVKGRNDYFLVPGRLVAIREKIHNLKFVGPKDIIAHIADDSDFSRVYFSNTLGDFRHTDQSEVLQVLNDTTDALQPNSLLYITYHASYSPPTLSNATIDTQLTAKAQALEKKESWRPVVYRVSEPGFASTSEPSSGAFAHRE